MAPRIGTDTRRPLFPSRCGVCGSANIVPLQVVISKEGEGATTTYPVLDLGLNDRLFQDFHGRRHGCGVSVYGCDLLAGLAVLRALAGLLEGSNTGLADVKLEGLAGQSTSYTAGEGHSHTHLH